MVGAECSKEMVINLQSTGGSSVPLIVLMCQKQETAIRYAKQLSAGAGGGYRAAHQAQGPLHQARNQTPQGKPDLSTRS
jgi:hypothetical protein